MTMSEELPAPGLEPVAKAAETVADTTGSTLVVKPQIKGLKGFAFANLHQRCTPEIEKELGPDVQGNILRPHARRHVAHVLVELPASAGDSQVLLQELLEKEWPTTAGSQREYARRYREAIQAGQAKQDAGPSSFKGLALSWHGYERLGAQALAPTGGAFKRGPEAAEDDKPESNGWTSPNFLEDPDFANWRGELGDVHLLLTLANNSAERRDKEVEELEAELKKWGGRSHVHRGSWDCVDKNPAIHREHFGYVDGISNVDLVGGSSGATWSSQYDLHQALLPDPGGDDLTSLGSFLVFCKLKQHVAEFRKDHPKAASGQTVVGRTTEGVPLARQEAGVSNDFTYGTDIGPEPRCPYEAHVRKVNPRHGQHRRSQIIRRGIPYGHPEDEDKGLLFAAYCRNIETQFERIQRGWIASGFPARSRATTLPKVGEDALLSKYVSMRGGGYFFAPSISALRKIST